MDRRVFVTTLTGAISGTSAAAWLGGPVGQWDGPIRFDHVFDSLNQRYFVGWRAEYHGREYGMQFPRSENCTLDDMFALLFKIQQHADETLTGLIQSGGSR